VQRVMKDMIATQ